MSVIKGVIDSSLPLADEDLAWSASDAIKAVKAFASNDDGDINFSTYKKAFFYVADGGGDNQGDYSLPFATVVDGKLCAVWNGVAAAMGALNGARGADPIPDADKEAVYKEICTYYKRFDKTPPDLSKALVKREVGERVDVMCNFEPGSVKDLGNGAFSATVTTSDIDRMGESIDSQGVDTTAFMQNPVVLYGHDYQGLPIGKATKISSFKNKITAQFQLAIAEYPFAATVAAMIKGGYLNAVSIGGVVRQWDETYTQIQQMEMVEFSVVPVPANPNALITAGFEKATGKTVEAVSKEFHDFVQQTTAERLEKSLDIDELDRHIKSLKDLTVILETAKTAKTNEKEISSEDDEVITLTIRKTAGKVSETGQKIIRLVKAKKED